MNKHLVRAFSLILLLALMSGNAYAAGADASSGYSTQWTVSEKQLGLSFEYQYSNWATNTGIFSVPTTNKAGNTYMIAHQRNDITSSTIICLDQNGKVKWRKDFKSNELWIDGKRVLMDQSGNLYYFTKKQIGKKHQTTAHSLSPEGRERWSFLIPDPVGEQLALRGDGSTVVATDNNLYLLSSAGKVFYKRSLPQLPRNRWYFLGASNGKVMYYSLSFTDKYEPLHNEINVYGSDNKLLYKLPAILSTGAYLSKSVKYMDDGNFLVIQDYSSLNNKPAILSLYDVKGKLKWKKLVYSRMEANDVFVQGNAIYYRSGGGSLLYPIPYVLHRLNAVTGAETSKLPVGERGVPDIYAGFQQEKTMGGDESIIQAASSDLFHPHDTSLYEIGHLNLRKIDADTLKVTADYTDSLEKFMTDTYGAYDCRVVAAHNGFAYVYFSDMQTKKYNLAKIILP